MNQNSTESVPEEVIEKIKLLIERDLQMPLKAEARRKPYGTITKQAIDEIVMEIKPLQAALNFLLESDLKGPEMRQVAKIQNGLMTVVQAAITAQQNLRQIKVDEAAEVEVEE